MNDKIWIILAILAAYILSMIHEGGAVMLLAVYAVIGVIIAMDRFSGGAL